LKVTAREQRSGQAAKIEVKPTYGLTDEQVESMILDSFDHAEEDFAKRLLIEARNEADSILAAVERAPQSPAWVLLTAAEQEAISAARRHLEAVKRGEDAKIIRDATLALDQATRRFAELMMDAAVSTAITGKTMGTADEDLGEAVTAPHPMAAAEFK
jgi:molecular chaperone DnaK (HSP70)